MRIERIVTGTLRANCYVLDDAAGTAIVIDPGDDGEAIANCVASRKLDVKGILATHGHVDHIGAAASLQRAFQCRFYLHSADVKLLDQAKLYAFVLYRRTSVQVPVVDHHLDALEAPLRFGDLFVEFYPTPGHTPGGVCFRIGDHLFTGDTLLADRAAETGWPEGDPAALAQSHLGLSALPGNWLIHPGHGEPAPLGEALRRAAQAQEAPHGRSRPR